MNYIKKRAKKQNAKKNMHVVKWVNSNNPEHNGQSQKPMSYETAKAWADEANKEYPNLIHSVVFIGGRK